jgi:hypothetical protein
MKTKKRRIIFFVVSIGIPIVIALTIWFAFALNRTRGDVYNATTICSYGDIRMDLSEFRNNHGRWPNDFEEAGCLNESKYRVIDRRTKTPYLYLADKNVYFYARREKILCKVFVMLPKPYRTNFWPFGKEQNIVMFSYPESLSLQELCVDPKDIIELKPGQKVVGDAD